MTHIIRVFDFETTGTPEPEPAPKPRICEIGWTDIITEPDGTQRISDTVSFFVNPGIPMPVQARAVHHISDADLVGAVSPTEGLTRLGAGADFFVAHKTDFEREFFGGGSKPWGCTYKASLRLWNNAPGHKNKELRYFLGLDDMPDFETAKAMPPHRAGPDSYTTAFITRELLRVGMTLTDMNVWERQPGLLITCWMKKYKGRKWSEVDKGYLNWILTTSDVKDPDILHTARFHLKNSA